MRRLQLWRLLLWCRLTNSDTWGFQIGIEYRKRKVTEGPGFKEWVIGFHFNESKQT
jgi:hypothetical protein